MMKFLKGFKYAFNGILYCIKNERNMRIHIAVMLCIVIFARFFKLTAVNWAILFLTFSIVISAEAINTAIEKLCDFVCKEKRRLIGIVKDVSAGAVLISAIFAVCVGVCTFWQPTVFLEIYNYYINNISELILIFLLLILLLLFVIFGGNKKKR